MGTIEIVIIIAIVVLIAVVAWFYVSNSEKIKADKQKKAEEEKRIAEEKKAAELASKAEQKSNAKAVMEQVSNQAEDYIKSLILKDEEKKKSKHSDIVFEETTEDLTLDPEEKDNAIVLGVKKQSVHIIEDEQEDDDLFSDYKENTFSILNSMDDEIEGTVIKGDPTKLTIDDFQEDSSVGEEFRGMSKEMKIMMLANVLGKKENQDK